LLYDMKISLTFTRCLYDARTQIYRWVQSCHCYKSYTWFRWWTPKLL